MKSPEERLSSIVEQLNALADRAIEKLHEAEQRIVRTNPAIPARAELPSGATIGWDVVAGRWCIVFVDDAHKLYPIKDAPRHVRIEAAAMLDKFLDALVGQVESWIHKQKAKIK